MKTHTTINEITHDDLVDLFSSACYGSNYLSVEYEESIEYNESDCHEDIIANILLNGGSVKVTDAYADGVHYGKLKYEYNEDNDAIYTVTLKDIKRGLERAANGTFNVGKNDEFCPDWVDRNINFAKRSFNAFTGNEEEWDAITADCLMQVILFNEIVYG